MRKEVNEVWNCRELELLVVVEDVVLVVCGGRCCVGCVCVEDVYEAPRGMIF